ncbi:hypothetical protein LX36DRAFT_663442 [Colletotrichum falcatum]|nr:hypothetical protein LX36DRAFT_663442 [Colletotrichum falcatum]
MSGVVRHACLRGVESTTSVDDGRQAPFGVLLENTRLELCRACLVYSGSGKFCSAYPAPDVGCAPSPSPSPGPRDIPHPTSTASGARREARHREDKSSLSGARQPRVQIHDTGGTLRTRAIASHLFAAHLETRETGFPVCPHRAGRPCAYAGD